MVGRLLHIYRNTPFGRETLLQSMYFCKQLGIDLNIFIPRMKRFLMYFEHEAIQIDLDDSYLLDPGSANGHIHEILDEMDMQAAFLEIEKYTATNLPDLPTDFEFMCCPRVIADLSSKIALGKIGSKVRKIMKNAPFPVLIPSQVFKPWENIMIMFGGSVNAVKSLQLGLKLGQTTGLPVDMMTMAQPGEREHYEQILQENNLAQQVQEEIRHWHFFEDGDFAENLFHIPHDSLVVMGAYGHGLIKDIMFGSKMELIQSTVPNSMLIAGPYFEMHPWYSQEEMEA